MILLIFSTKFNFLSGRRETIGYIMKRSKNINSSDTHQCQDDMKLLPSNTKL